MARHIHEQEVFATQLLIDAEEEDVSHISTGHIVSLEYESDIVSLGEFFQEITNEINTKELIAVHHAGTPGEMTIGVMGHGAPIHGLNMELGVQVRLPREESDAYYNVSIKSYSEMSIYDSCEFDSDQPESENYPVYDTIDMTYCTPVQLLDEASKELVLTDGIEYLQRKLHHQYNGGTVEPKRWYDLLPDLRDGELDTSGMIDTA